MTTLRQARITEEELNALEAEAEEWLEAVKRASLPAARQARESLALLRRFRAGTLTLSDQIVLTEMTRSARG